MITRGDIRWFRFGSPDKRRPVLVLGKPDVLPSLNQVPVIPLSTQVRGLAWEVALTEGDGLPSACVVKPEWIRIVDRASLGLLSPHYRRVAGPRFGPRCLIFWDSSLRTSHPSPESGRAA